MDSLIRLIGTVGLYLILWVLIFMTTYFVKEKFYRRTDDWFSAPIIAAIVASLAIGYLFIHNHVAITP